jgi:hypothetical protein
MPDQEQTQEKNVSNGVPYYLSDNHLAQTSRYIAYSLLGTFSLCLFLMMFFSYNSQENERKEWFGLLRDGFILLGGTLSTVIGYYFGSRSTQEANARAQMASIEAVKAKEEVTKASVEAVKAKEDATKFTGEADKAREEASRAVAEAAKAKEEAARIEAEAAKAKEAAAKAAAPTTTEDADDIEVPPQPSQP